MTYRPRGRALQRKQEGPGPAGLLAAPCGRPCSPLVEAKLWPVSLATTRTGAGDGTDAEQSQCDAEGGACLLENAQRRTGRSLSTEQVQVQVQ